jgi:hypothetical protein
VVDDALAVETVASDASDAPAGSPADRPADNDPSATQPPPTTSATAVAAASMPHQCRARIGILAAASRVLIARTGRQAWRHVLSMRVELRISQF